MKLVRILFCLFLLQAGAQEIVGEEIAMSNGDVLIPGTLSYPDVQKPLPLVIFIQGSGNVNRDGNQAGTLIQSAYIKTFRDSLNVRGIGFYSYDKRTSVPGNISKLIDIRFSDLVDDARLAIEKYASDSRFNSLHVIGHSQGSLVGMLSLSPKVKTFISLAGPGVPIDKKIVEQITAQSPELGEIAAQHFSELQETDTIASINPMLIQVFAPQNQQFLKGYAALDPAVEISKVTLPTLIINGDADIQISPEDAQLLYAALPGSQLEIIPKLNHVLKEVNSMAENQQAYMQPDVPLSPGLLKTITKFIAENQ
ncbi:MAG: lysophospholipase [Eudoraea sp.]|nr:lysophospholipase [Eudoraea sp.]NNK30247.1 alpha/beta hydrolase [Flavobacteriaceae bacterium]